MNNNKIREQGKHRNRKYTIILSLICEEFSKRKLFSIFNSVYMNEEEIEIYSMTCNNKIYPEKTVLLGGFMRLCVSVMIQEIDRRQVLGRGGCSSFRRAKTKTLTMLFLLQTERMCSAWNYGLETQRASGRVHPTFPSQNTTRPRRSNA